MIYEFWNTETGNLVASFDGEEEALAFAGASLREHGMPYVERLTLAREDRHGRTELVADGPTLVDLTLARRDAIRSSADGLARSAST